MQIRCLGSCYMFYMRDACTTTTVHSYHVGEAPADGHVELDGRQRGRAQPDHGGAALHVVGRADADDVAERVAQRRRRHRRQRYVGAHAALDAVSLRWE